MRQPTSYTIYDSGDLQFVQDDIRAIEEWSTNNNYLSLNSSMCKYMLISRKRNSTLPECPLILNNCKLKILILLNILVFCCQRFDLVITYTCIQFAPKQEIS